MGPESMPEQDAREFWRSVIEWTMSESEAISFSKELENGESVPRPEDAGLLVRSVGELHGQDADWRASLSDDRRGFHAVEYSDHYECHLDNVDPMKDPVGHLVEDSPATLALGIGIAALALGVTLYYISRRASG
jgi:hypothetical protein